MNDIFISYANADRAVAQSLADALDALGWSVWWDREIPFGKPFDQVIEEELNAARCVVVLWSKDSVRSRWVKAEAAAAADRDRLIPMVIDDSPLPLEFRRIQSAMLPGWNGDRTHPEFVQLVDSVTQMLGQPRVPQPATLPPRPPVLARSSNRNTKVALGGGVVVLAVIALLIGRSLFRASANDPSPSSDDPKGISSPSGQPCRLRHVVGLGERCCGNDKRCSSCRTQRRFRDQDRRQDRRGCAWGRRRRYRDARRQGCLRVQRGAWPTGALPQVEARQGHGADRLDADRPRRRGGLRQPLVH